LIRPPPPHVRRSSFIIATITLTAILLISSPVMTVFSTSSLTPVILKVEFASATTTSENGDDDESTTDATTDGEEDEQQEEEAEQDGELQEQQQLATVIGEVCDDFEDNDGDGLIDLADVEDCAPPATQGTITAPTTPPPPSVINTTATNSTNNTLTAAGITTESPYIVEVCGNRFDDDGDGLADEADFEGCATPSTDSSNTRYILPSTGEIVDVTGCESYEELGLPPPPPRAGLDEPPNLVYFDCDNVTFGLIPLDSAPATTTSDSSTGTAGGGGGQGLAQGQGQQQPNSASPCPPQPTNYYDAPAARIIHVQLPPSSPSSPPPPQTTTTPCPPGESSSSAATPPGTTTSQGQQPPPSSPQQQVPGTTSPDSTGGTITDTVITDYGTPDGPSITTKKAGGTIIDVGIAFPDDTKIVKKPGGTVDISIDFPPISVTYSPKDGIIVDRPSVKIEIGPDNVVKIWNIDDDTLTTYNSDGFSITQDSSGRVIKFSNPNDATINSYQGKVTTEFPNGPSIAIDKKGIVPVVEFRFPDGTAIDKYSRGGAAVYMPQANTTTRVFTIFSSDGTIGKGGIGDLNVVKPDNTVSIKKPDGTFTYNTDGNIARPDGTLIFPK
jgi:hypothetical protein